MNTFPWLIKREYWEHRGGFLWAPVVTGGVYLALTLMALVVAMVSADRVGFKINNIDLGEVTENLSASQLVEVGASIDLSLYMTASLIGVVAAIVVFFYCLGSLYDDRKDRSVLFWKSLPVSDRGTVASKALSALLLVPAIAAVAAIATGVGFLLLMGGYVALYGVNPFRVIWGPASPLSVALHLLATLPVHAVWALPTVGWLMLCSAWARSKPFLWAIAIPVGAGIIVSWFDVLQRFAIPDFWFWKNIVFRMLFSVVPASWLDLDVFEHADIQGPSEVLQMLDLASIYSVLGRVDTWIGAAAGVAMLVASVYFRRRRDDA
ncbi:MAG TPA: ABC-2 transporter permease [Xanthomonadaceae bacterium]|nr:ABC-2 transporter permease [Xanthomonadaceae bacterium]